MGLRCSHNAFHGAYSAFDRLRRSVTEAIGGSWPPHEDPDLNPRSWYYREDYDLHEHPGLVIFLSHSDCDGVLTPEECCLVVKDLKELVDLVSEKHGYGHLSAQGGVRESLIKFIKGCENAIEKNEDLEFR